ncbi:phage tail fiber protein [Budvicia aquatica]|uniref:Prophage tail fibre N-terminal n=1 Tax=Budvicia aquatica TaxID=82979 RepID=A0A2C6DQD4_9GAMM|nr:prophage tail fiber N-terminal domain-containing protein [Budvicia aquatica]PHI31021.1 hypothetical protein CRN84_17620 [Budvicia aquatica]VFS51175.1 Prophage tail fibre N-terminal [Budvicia aquatica]
MAIKISGILKDGMGRPIPKCTIELLCKKTSLTVVVETEARIGLDNTGSYNMQVEPGKYDVSLYIVGFPPKRVGEIQVYLDSRPGTLNDFLTIPGESDLTPELVAIFQQLRNEAQQAANEAKANKELADSILTDVVTVQMDVNEKQQQVNTDMIEAGKFKVSAAASAKTASESSISTAVDVVTVTALKTAAEQAASSAAISNDSVIENAEKAEAAAVSAEASKVSASADAVRSDAARVISEGIQTDLTHKYNQVVSDTAAVLEAKTTAVNAANSAKADAALTSQDRTVVSADKQTVANDKIQSQTSAATATEKSSIAVTEANRAKVEADRAAEAMSGKQDKSQLLTSMSGLTTAANQLIYSNGVNTVTTTSLTALGRLIVAAANAAGARTTIGAAEDAKVLKIENNLSDLNNTDEAVKNLKLDVELASKVNIGLNGTLPRYGRGIPGNNFNNALIGWCFVGGIFSNAPSTGSIYGSVLTYLDKGTLDYTSPPAVGIDTEWWHQIFINTDNRIYMRQRINTGGWSQWYELYSSRNTAIDANGFIKKASPIVKLFSNGFCELNEESSGVTTERLSEGIYRLSGSLMGFHSDGAWDIEVPNDDNKQPLIWVNTTVEANGDIIVKTYHRTHPNAPRFAQNTIEGYNDGDPIDIPSGRWIDLRVQVYTEELQTPT